MSSTIGSRGSENRGAGQPQTLRELAIARDKSNKSLSHGAAPARPIKPTVSAAGNITMASLFKKSVAAVMGLREKQDLCGNQPVRRVHPTILH